MRGALSGKPQPGQDLLHPEPQVDATLQQGDWKKVSDYPENTWRLYHPSRNQTALQDLSGYCPEKLPKLPDLSSLHEAQQLRQRRRLGGPEASSTWYSFQQRAPPLLPAPLPLYSLYA